MKLKECPSCAMKVDAAARTCPICQYEFTERPATLKWVTILLVLLLLLYFLFI